METQKKIISELEESSPAIVWVTLFHVLYVLFQRTIIRLGHAVTLRERSGLLPLVVTLFLCSAVVAALMIANPGSSHIVGVIYVNLIFIVIVSLGIAIRLRAGRFIPDPAVYNIFTFQVYGIIGAGIAAPLYHRSLFAALVVIFGYAACMVCLAATAVHLGAAAFRSLRSAPSPS